MRDDERDLDPTVEGEARAGSQDRKTRVKGDRVIHTVNGTLYHGDRYEGPRGLTTEQNEARRTGVKLDERQARQTGFGGHLAKPPLERLDGTDEVSGTKKGRGEK
jgi:hypothetical protein